MKDKLSFSVFELEKTAMPDGKETVRSGYDYVSWGKDNRFPNDLYDMYQNSAILQSVINGTADYVFGSGVISAFDVVNDKYETLEDVVKRCVFDLLIFGGFAIQLMYKGGKVEAMYWLDFQKCRKSEDEKKVYYSDDWGKYAKKALEYNAWTPDTDKGTCIFYYKGHKTRGIYPVPMYIGALKSVKISTEISNFHLNNIMKGFASNAVISFNNGEPDEDTKARIEKDVKEKFCGTDNAGSFLLLFNESKDNACEIAKIQDDKFDEKYQSLAKYVKDAKEASEDIADQNSYIDIQDFSSNSDFISSVQNEVNETSNMMNETLANNFQLEDSDYSYEKALEEKCLASNNNEIPTNFEANDII